MNKHLITLLCLAIVALSGLLIAADADLDKNFLTKKPFNYGTIISNGSLALFGDNTYTFEYGSEGVNWYNKGSYSVNKGKVNLKPDVCSSHKDGETINCAGTMGEADCSIQTKANDLYFFKYFVCTSKKNKNAVSTNMPSMAFPIGESKVKAGTSKVYKGIPVVSMGMVKGMTTTNVKIREKPSVNAKAIEYIKEIYSPDSSLPSVPAKTEVIVVARTRDRDKVENWNNYWYLVSVGVNSEVWMYSEFVKIK